MAIQRVRLIAKMPTIAAFVFRHSRGLPYVLPRTDLGYIGNFVNMTFEIGRPVEFLPTRRRSRDPVDDAGGSVRLLARRIAGIGALACPLHGGANEAVLTEVRRGRHVKHVAAHHQGV